jgi:predicted transcriptional regulator of viral defense system
MGITDNILEALSNSYPLPMGIKELENKVNANYNTVRGSLGRLTKRGEIENIQPGYYKFIPVSLRKPRAA